MLTIRAQQFAVLSQHAVKDFVVWMTDHIRRHFPSKASVLGETGLESLIRAGIIEAREYGVTSRRDVCKFIDLSLLFGRGFAIRCAWAATIVNAGQRSDIKMRRLIDAALQQLSPN